VGEYVTRPEQLRLLPAAADGIRALSQAGLRVVVVTNQRGIALGRMTVSDLDAIHRKMLGDLAASNAQVDAIYYCPHDVGQCDCRKPSTGMFERARDELSGIDFARSVVIGDSPNDWQAGRALGCRLIAIGDPGHEQVDRVEPSLGAAAAWLTRHAEGAETLTRG
jgi:D-glycero-D-manno-heptose 1,7-bisphosphate phosphatase